MRPCRRVLAVMLLTAAPSLAQPHASTPLPSVSGLAPVALPLPAIGLPLASMGIGPETRTTAEPQAPTPGSRRGRHAGWLLPAPVYVWVPTAPDDLAARPRARDAHAALPVRPASGVLHLDIQPRLPQQVWVDGAFVGGAGDLGSELRLVAGRHRIELREPGYLALLFEVEITADRAITYRDSLVPDSSATPLSGPAPGTPTGSGPPIPRKPLYWIPGCYMGDVPPRDAGLPAACDPARAVVYRP